MISIYSIWINHAILSLRGIVLSLWEGSIYPHADFRKRKARKISKKNKQESQYMVYRVDVKTNLPFKECQVQLEFVVEDTVTRCT